jgi:hypothetical protein
MLLNERESYHWFKLRSRLCDLRPRVALGKVPRLCSGCWHAIASRLALDKESSKGKRGIAVSQLFLLWERLLGSFQKKT